MIQFAIVNVGGEINDKNEEVSTRINERKTRSILC